MKDLILISAFCNTKDKEEVLRGLVNDCQAVKDKFDIMLVSHTVIPDDIAEKTDYSLYDKKNELLYDWDMRGKSWLNIDDTRIIFSIFTCAFNTHLAVWRLVILGNSLAKNLGYEKVHHLEYDAHRNDFSELHKNSNILDDHDAVLYMFSNSVVPFGSYQAYRVSSLDPILYDLNEDKIKKMIKDSPVKSPEEMFGNLLNNNQNVVRKTIDDLFLGNHFAISHSTQNKLNWRLPYYDKLTSHLCFVIWNNENIDENLNVTLIYNKENIRNFCVAPSIWHVNDLGKYEDAKELLVILNGKVYSHFKFDECREQFKEVSFREG